MTVPESPRGNTFVVRSLTKNPQGFYRTVRRIFYKNIPTVIKVLKWEAKESFQVHLQRLCLVNRRDLIEQSKLIPRIKEERLTDGF